MFYENLKELCKQRNTTVTRMLSDLNLSTANTGNWKKGLLPKGETLKAMAAYLKTSVDYLLTGEYVTGLTKEEEELLRLYRSIPERVKYKVFCDFERTVSEEKQKWLQGQDL